MTTVLRQPSQNQGTRRLPGLDLGTQASSQTGQDRQFEAKSALREAFATELLVLEQESRARGLAEGRQEAARQARVELAQAQAQQEQQWLKKEAALRGALETERARLGEVVEALTQQHKQLLTSMEPVVGRVALAIVTRLLGQQGSTRSLVADLARQAIEEYRVIGLLRIRVAGADYDALLRLAPEDPLLGALQVDPDAVVGSCVIDFEGGQLDAGLDTQWTKVKALLLSDTQGDGHVASA